jgi:hypothetical protein
MSGGTSIRPDQSYQALAPFCWFVPHLPHLNGAATDVTVFESISWHCRKSATWMVFNAIDKLKGDVTPQLGHQEGN